MRKTVKFSAYTLAGLTLLMGLLILVAVGLSNTDLARRTVLERINATLNGRLTLTDHHLALFGGRFELRDLALKSPGGETLIALDRFLLDWRWRDLLGRTLHLSEVALEDPRGRLSIGADGRLNLLDLFPSAAEARPDPDPDPDALAGELPINHMGLDYYYDE